MNENAKFFILLAIGALYVVALMLPQSAMLFAIFVPLMILQFVRISGANRLTLFGLIIVFSVGAFFRPLGAFFFILAAVVPAVAIFLAHKYDKHDLWHAPTLAPIPIFIAVAVWVYFVDGNREIYTQMIVKAIEDGVSPMGALNADDAQKSEAINQVIKNKEKIANYFVSFAPAIVYSFVSMLTYFSDRIFYKIQSSRRIIQLPDIFVWFVALGGLPLLFKVEPYRTMGITLLIMVGTLYFFRGLDVLRFLFTKYNVHFVIRILIFFTLAVEPIFAAFIAAFGLSSVYVDFMKDDTKESKENRTDEKK